MTSPAYNRNNRVHKTEHFEWVNHLSNHTKFDTIKDLFHCSILNINLPETSTTPEKALHPKKKVFSQPPLFSDYVSVREGILDESHLYPHMFSIFLVFQSPSSSHILWDRRFFATTNTLLHSMKYWLFYRDPYNVLWNNPHATAGFHPLYTL